MIVFVDENELVASGFAAGFGREGMPMAAFRPMDFREWLTSAPQLELNLVEAFILGACEQPEQVSKGIRRASRAPVIALRDNTNLESTLALFDAGVDDVVRKPINVRELLARIEAVRRRGREEPAAPTIGRLRVYFDGRYPEVDDEPFPLPRRERRILEYLTVNRGKWVTKQQVFLATYGLFDDEVQESVVESHVSKLRRKLTAALGSDPIEARRFLGYRIPGVRDEAPRVCPTPLQHALA